MEKKLPKVFANRIDKKINNNNRIYVSKKETINSETKPEKNINKTINQKLKEIMNTKKYAYKIPVKIVLKDKELITNIIGKNNSNIITIDNELIKIEDIENIEIQEKNE